ncbi:hypothetical protein AAG906_035653 [Vitis piasezkii]
MRSATPFCCGVPGMVFSILIPCAAQYSLNPPSMYSPPLSDLKHFTFKPKISRETTNLDLEHFEGRSLDHRYKSLVLYQLVNIEESYEESWAKLRIQLPKVNPDCKEKKQRGSAMEHVLDDNFCLKKVFLLLTIHEPCREKGAGNLKVEANFAAWRHPLVISCELLTGNPRLRITLNAETPIGHESNGAVAGE